MAPKGIEMGLALALVVMLLDRATAQSGCTSAFMGMAPCLNYVTGNSSTPSSSCCSQLASGVQSKPQCLCSVLNGGGASLGITVNQTQALALPGACNVQTPPVSQCNAVANGPTTSTASPASSPTRPPADSSNGTPKTPTTPSVPSIPSGTPSKTVPGTNGSTSDGSLVTLPLHLTIFAIFLTTCVSNVLRV